MPPPKPPHSPKPLPMGHPQARNAVASDRSLPKPPPMGHSQARNAGAPDRSSPKPLSNMGHSQARNAVAPDRSSPKSLPMGHPQARNAVVPDRSSGRVVGPVPQQSLHKPPGPGPQQSLHKPPGPVLLQQSSHKKGQWKTTKLFRRVKSVFRSFPVINPPCKMPVSLHGGGRPHDGHIHGGKQMTGTLFGHRKARVNLAIQENPRSLPLLVLELSIHTGKLLQDMGSGLVRIALESEKNPSEKLKLIDEPIWTMYCNGRKVGYAVKREPTDDDLRVMQKLHAVSMGAGVLPIDNSPSGESPDGELTYMRAYFERVVGSKDSETYYMMNPDGNSGPDLSIFFVRI